MLAKLSFTAVLPGVAFCWKNFPFAWLFPLTCNPGLTHLWSWLRLTLPQISKAKFEHQSPVLDFLRTIHALHPFVCSDFLPPTNGRQNAASISEPGDLREFPKQKTSTNQSKLTCHISSKQGAWWHLHVWVGLEQCSPWEPQGCSTGASRSWYQAECSEECRTGSGSERCCNPTL